MRRWHPRRGEGKFGVAPKALRTVGGVAYASGAEAGYAGLLSVLVRAGEVTYWARGERIPLQVNGLLVGHYRPDFVVDYADGHQEWVEVKGKWNEADRLRVRLAIACHSWLNIRCVRRVRGQFENIERPEPSKTLSLRRPARRVS